MSCGGFTHVRPQFEVASTANDVLVGRIVQVTVQDLFRQRQRSLQPENAFPKIPPSVKTNTTHLSRTIARLSSMRW